MEDFIKAKPLSRKVWAGRFTPDSLILETTAGTDEVGWNEILQINLGRILNHYNPEDLKEATAGEGAMNLVPFLGEYLKNKNSRNIELNNYLSCLIFAVDRSNPFRIDSNGTSLRSFLGDEACLSGQINFIKCIRTILEKSTEARLDPSAGQFLETGKKTFSAYRNIADFLGYGWRFKENIKTDEPPPKRAFTKEEWEENL